MGAGLCPCLPGGFFFVCDYFYFYFTHFRMLYLAAVLQTDDSGASWTKDDRKAEKEFDMLGLVTSERAGCALGSAPWNPCWAFE